MILLILLACTPEPEPCDDMCAAAAVHTADCLAADELDWPAAGYDDEADFLDACATWAWELRVLDVDPECAAREQALSAGELSCEEVW